MRTTLDIDNDLVVELERLAKVGNATLSEVVNAALRRGLKEIGPHAGSGNRFEIKTFSLGPASFPIDNIEEAIALAEGENHG